MMKKTVNILFSFIIGLGILLSSYLFNGAARIVLICIGGAILIFTLAETYFYFANKRKSDVQNGGEDSEDKKEVPKYLRKKSLMTNVERNFYRTLCSLFQDKYDVIYQVVLSSVIDKITQNSYRNELFRTIDFCLVSKDNFAPLLLIELNDSSHDRADRLERDKRVREIVLSAGMPIVAFKTQEISDVAYIKRVVRANILKN